VIGEVHAGLYALTRIDRYVICEALRTLNGRQRISGPRQRVIDLLKPTPEETAVDLAYVRAQAARCGAGSKSGEE
jgi:hypothetical protein